MTDQETFFQQYENWVLKDIRLIMKLENGSSVRLEPDRTAFNERRPLVAAVILICCAIDCLARFRFGQTTGNVGRAFKNFVHSYFDSTTTRSGKSYDDERIYNGMRNALVHGYSLQNDLGLVHQSDQKHLETIDNRVIVDVFSLYYDLEAAYNKYKDELMSGSYLIEFTRRWQVYPLIQYMPDKDIKGTV